MYDAALQALGFAFRQREVCHCVGPNGPAIRVQDHDDTVSGVKEVLNHGANGGDVVGEGFVGREHAVAGW